MAWRVEGCEVCCQSSIGAASGEGGAVVCLLLGSVRKKKIGWGPLLV